MTTPMPRHLTPVPDGDNGHPAALPHDNDAERAVLAALLTRPRTAHDLTGQLTPNDFYRPSHQLIYDAVLALQATDTPIDIITVADHLATTGNLPLIGGRSTLHDLATNTPLTDPGYHADIIRDHANRRAYHAAGMRIITAATTPTLNPQDIAHEVTDALDTAAAGHTTAPLATPIDLFLAADQDDQPCWISPGFLERQDRIIVTAAEGAGKSTLLRMWAVQLAAGIHPFTLNPQPPIRVTLLDLENSARQTRRKLRPLAHQAGTRLHPDQLNIASRPEGIDLTTPQDRAWLDTLLDQTRPDVLIGGPIYKMAGGDPNTEVDSKPAAMALDRARTRYDCALILEAHPKKSPDGKPTSRAKEPFGWSGWMRWPEFGIHLAEGGDITHWRGMRDERDFPLMLNRGGVWPWTAVTDPDEQTFQRVCEIAFSNNTTSIRQICDVGVGMGRTKVAALLNGRFSHRWAGVKRQIGDSLDV